MAVYYKFKSAKDYVSIPVDGHFISVSNLKDRIYESKHLGRGTDHDIEVINAQTNEEYPHEAVIPKNTSVLIRRVPRRSGMPIVTQPEESMVENRPEDDLPKANLTSVVSSVKDLEPPEWDDEFGHDLYAPIPEVIPSQASSSVWEDPPPSKDDEDSKIKALIETSALDWQSQGAEGFRGRGFGRGGRMMGGRGFGRIGERQIPPQGYVCHRCRVPGHFIQHCPTNGDPNYDTKKVKPPTGIPRTMLMANPEGTMVMPSGAVGVLQPNEAAFEKEMEGIPSTRSLADLPPELHCPLCKEVMKDAVLTSKCCFTSFCDKCIRDYIMSKSVCVCGVRDILADDLLPNKTLRDTINRILSSTNSSGDNAGSTFQVQDMESARYPQPKAASPMQSAAVKLEHVPPASVKETPKETADAERSADPPPQALTQQTSDKLKTAKVPNISEASHESASAREPESQGIALPAEEEVQQKLATAEVKKKKKKKPCLPINATEMQWRNAPDFAADSFMMPMGPSSYNPYWNGMQPGFQLGIDGFMGSYGGGMPYNMGYGVGPMDVHFPGVVPHDPFMAQNPMFPMMPPPRDFGMGFNVRPPLMTRQEFEARQASLRRKREIERMGERETPKDRDPGREISSSVKTLSMKSKPHSAPSRREPSEGRYDRERNRHHNDDHDHRPLHGMSSNGSSNRKADRHQPSSDGDDHRDSDRDRDRNHRHHHYRRSESSTKPSSEVPLSAQPPQKPSSATAAAAAERKLKTSVFSRISFPEKGEEPSKKRKRSSEPKPSSKEAVPPANGEGVAASSSTGRKSHRQSQVEYESSDDDRHFKRKPSRYQPSPPRQEDTRRSNDRARERERDSSAHSSRHR